MEKRNIIICNSCSGSGCNRVQTVDDEERFEACGLCEGSGRIVEVNRIERLAFTPLPITSVRPEPASEPPAADAVEPVAAAPVRPQLAHPFYVMPNDPEQLAPVVRYLVMDEVLVYAEYDDGELQRAAHLTPKLVSTWVEGGHGYYQAATPMEMERIGAAALPTPAAV